MLQSWPLIRARSFRRDPSYGGIAVSFQRAVSGRAGVLPFFGVLPVLALWLALVVFMMSCASASARPLRIVALGDSLTAGYGLPMEAAFPSVLERALRARGHQVEIINAGVSGDTSSGGLARLDWSVPDGTDGVIVELGANDALRGIDPAVTRAALDEIVTRLKARGIAVMLAGMLAPRNLGEDYGRAFDGIYPALAQKHAATLYPFFLDGVAGVPRLNLQDGLHPTAEGVQLVVQRMLPSVEAFLATIKPAR
jgi:acyl-CoA thioesterase I